jgi:hypothetical protein
MAQSLMWFPMAPTASGGHDYDLPPVSSFAPITEGHDLASILVLLHTGPTLADSSSIDARA